MHQWWVTAHLRGSIFQTLATLRRWFLASLRRHSEKLSSMGITVHHNFQTIGDPRKESQKKKPLTMESNVTLVDFWVPPVSLHPAASEPPAIRSDAIFMPTNPTKQISQEAWHFLPLMVPQCWFDVEKIKACHKKMETFFRDVEEWRWYFQIPSCSFYFGMLPCAGLGYPLFIAGWLRSPVNLLPMIGYPSASITLNTEGPSDFRLTLEDASSNGPGHFRMILWSQLTSTRDSWPSFPWIHCTCWTTYMLQVLYPCGTPKIGHPVKSSLHILLVVVIYIY